MPKDVGSETDVSSLNSLGYSPIKLKDYIEMVKDIEDASKQISKPVIFSVTGSITQVADGYQLLLNELGTRDSTWAMEVNLSCPNIDGNSPPAYSKVQLLAYLIKLHEVSSDIKSRSIKIGIKTPPYTYQGQYENFVAALEETAATRGKCAISFITAINTLGSCLVIDPSTDRPAINSANGSGIGGLTGTTLHHLALGNVRTLRRMLNERPMIKGIEIIGVGGVSDGAGFRRMMNAGVCSWCGHVLRMVWPGGLFQDQQ